MSKVEVHMIHPFPPSCVNREGGNRPKMCDFGGVSRGRMSSQCAMYSIRQMMQQIDKDEDFGIRTMPEKHLVDKLAGMGDAQTVKAVAHLACACFLPKSKKDKENDAKKKNSKKSKSKANAKAKAEVEEASDEADENASDDSEEDTEKNGKKQVLRFLSRVGYDEFVRLCRENFQELAGGTVSEDLKSQLSDAFFRKSIGTIAFGRMMAELPIQNLESAIQASHAISVNVCQIESDYFTGCDDLNTSADQGAAHLNDQDFITPVFYRYFALDTSILEEAGASQEAICKFVADWLKSVIFAMPTGKKTSFAHFTLPDFVAVTVKDEGRQSNLVSAFMNPIDCNISDAAVDKLSDYWNRINKLCASKNDDGTTKKFITFGAYCGVHTPDPLPVDWEQKDGYEDVIKSIIEVLKKK